MTISLLVLLIPVALLVALFRLRGGEDVVVIDPSAAISQARSTKAYAVVVPSGLPGQWRPVSATFRRGTDGAVLRLGYLTPSGGAVQLVESNEPLAPLMARELGDQIRPVGATALSGREWQSFQVRGSERALVLTEAGRTVIITGRAEPAELEQLAAALR